MTLTQRLVEDMKQAMRARETQRLESIRFLRAQIKNKEIEVQHPLSDTEVVDVIRRLVHQRQESIEQFSKAGRNDLVVKEEAELALLGSYLPPQLSRRSIEDAARTVIAEVGAVGPGDMRKVMPVLLPRLQGAADGRLVAEVVTALLRDGQ
ncbi:MAG: GatB/YqeY domain-containing protein [Chloroflexi bacterium]|nr:GatB/YqeY domain-containing protein [Chloroflexota bacterium]